MSNKRFGGLLHGVEDQGKGRGAIAEGEQFLNEEEVVDAAVGEGGVRHDVGVL